MLDPLAEEDTMPAIYITALNDAIDIVHIPVSLAAQYATELYWMIEQAPTASVEFFNVTSNRIEIAVFASTELVSQEWAAISEKDSEIRISQAWKVFEISSGDVGDGGNYDSPHLRQVSAPLAEAGISILYQSSYFTDFILVKEIDFEKTSAIFAQHNWQIDSTTSEPPRRRSQIYTPITPIHTPTLPTHPPSPIHPPTMPELTVLRFPLACVGFSLHVERIAIGRIRQLLVWPERTLQLRYDIHVGDTHRPFISYTRTQDGSSLLTEIRILKIMFPREGGEVVELQSGGELAWADEDEDLEINDDSDNEHEHEQQNENNSPASTRKYIHSEYDGMITPPSEQGHYFSLPASPTSLMDGQTQTSIPIAWSGQASRSISPTRPRPRPRPRRQTSERGDGGKRCLQLDLRGVHAGTGGTGEEGEGEEGRGGAEKGGVVNYHLDKSGLLVLFSSLLNTSHIRMLYSSTTNTANILVEAEDVSRAKRLLEGGGGRSRSGSSLGDEILSERM